MIFVRSGGGSSTSGGSAKAGPVAPAGGGASPAKGAAARKSAQQEKERQREQAEAEERLQEDAQAAPDGQVPFEELLAAKDPAELERVRQGGRVYVARVAPDTDVKAPDTVDWDSGGKWPVDVVVAHEQDGQRVADEVPEGATLSFRSEAQAVMVAAERPFKPELSLWWNEGYTPLAVTLTAPDGRQWKGRLELPRTNEGRGELLLLGAAQLTPDEAIAYELHLKDSNPSAWRKEKRSDRLHLGRVNKTVEAAAPDRLAWVNPQPFVLDLYGVEAGEQDGEIDKREVADGWVLDRIPDRARVKVTDAQTGDVLVEDRDFETHLELLWDASVSRVRFEVALKSGRKQWAAEFDLPTEPALMKRSAFLLLERTGD